MDHVIYPSHYGNVQTEVKKVSHFITSYVQPIMQQYESTTVFVIKVATTDDLHNKWMQSTLFVVNKDEWDTKEGRGKSTKNAFYVQRYGKRHLSG